MGLETTARDEDVVKGTVLLTTNNHKIPRLAVRAHDVSLCAYAFLSLYPRCRSNSAVGFATRAMMR